MDPGNSGAKLNLALSPNQIIQDNTVKNCAEGLKDAIWLIWRTLVAHADDWGVRKLAQEFHPEGKPVFMDGERFENYDFNERKTIHIDLAMGMNSEENSLQRIQLIKQAQTQFNAELQQMIVNGIDDPTLFKKIRKPYEDMLYALSVKEADVYLVTLEEAAKMAQQAAQKAQAAAEAAKANPPAAELKDKASAALDQAKTQQVMADVSGASAKMQLDGVSLIGEHKARAF